MYMLNSLAGLDSIPVHIQNHSLSVSKAAVKPQSGPIYQVDAVYSQNKGRLDMHNLMHHVIMS